MATAALHSISAQDLSQLAYNGPPPGALVMSPGMYTVHDLAGQATAIRKNKLVLSRFEQAKRDLSRGREHEVEDRMKAAYYYTSVPVEDVIGKLGWWNPIACGRPKEFAFKLLLGMLSPASFKSFKWKMCGLTYFTPPIVGHSRSKSRTTVAGLALLRHWSNEFPKFKRFFDAFHDPKAEKEITLDCIDFALGYIPGHFQRTIEANIRKEEECKRKEMLAKMQAESQSQQYHMAKAQMQKQTDASTYQKALQQISGTGNLTVTATEMLARQRAMQAKADARGIAVPTYFSTLLGVTK